MDQISLPSLVFASFPEGIVVAILGLLCIGKANYIKEINNIIRIILFGVIYAVAAYYIRRIANNVIENSLIYLILICLSYIFIMRLKFYESIMASILGFVVVIFVIQTISLVAVMQIFSINLNDVYESDILRFLITLPERFLEFIIIYLGCRFNIRIIDFESTTVKKKEYYIQLFVYIVSISTLIFLVVIMANTIFFNDTKSLQSTDIVLIRLNIYLSLFVTIVLTLAIKSTRDFYKAKSTLNNNEILQSLEYIQNLIDNKDYANATKTISILKSRLTNEQDKNLAHKKIKGGIQCEKSI